MQHVEIKLKIADVIIKMQSRFRLMQISDEEQRLRFCERYNNFFYTGRKKPDILIDVKIVKKLPQSQKAGRIFITRHPGDRNHNWQLFKNRCGYIYKSPIKDKSQVMFINRDFNRVTAHLLPRKKREYVWDALDIIYDFLQVLLINYFAQRKTGVFVHAVALKDVNGTGFLFPGKSGAGKSTTARIWHNQSRAMVLNDDRIIVRKRSGNFLIYGTPWHGAFDDYLASRIEPAVLSKIFFIYHSLKNAASPIPKQEAFKVLYPTILPTFWDKICLENIISFCNDLIKNVRCFHLGFEKDKKIIGFIRKL